MGPTRPGKLRTFALALLLATPATARTLNVGPGTPYPALAQAAAAAQDGDTIHIAAGSYFECAVIARNGITIEGEDPGTTLTDTTCQGKALLILLGHDTTIRNLTLARARVPDGNGAGIRLEGPGLTVDHVQFDNNQSGILSGASGGQIRVTGSTFTAGGVPGDRPKFAIMAGTPALLQVEQSHFTGVKGGQVSTDADTTLLNGNTIESGIEPGAPAAIVAGGHTLVVQNNVFTLGPHAPAQGAAILATTGEITLQDNRLENRTGHPQALLRDWSSSTPRATGNTVGPGDTVVTSGGIWRHRASVLAHGTWDFARTAAGAAKRTIRSLFGR